MQGNANFLGSENDVECTDRKGSGLELFAFEPLHLNEALAQGHGDLSVRLIAGWSYRDHTNIGSSPPFSRFRAPSPGPSRSAS